MFPCYIIVKKKGFSIPTLDGIVPQVNQVYKTPFYDQVGVFNNQIEILLFIFQERLEAFARKYRIHLQAFSSLGSSSRSRILANNIINKIAQK